MDKKIIQKPLVSYLDAELKEAAENFSKRHNLRFCTPREIRKSFSSNLIILITNKGIFLQDLSLKNSKPFDLNFISFRERLNSKHKLLTYQINFIHNLKKIFVSLIAVIMCLVEKDNFGADA